MENYTLNDNSESSKGGPKLYERKIRTNQNSHRIYNTEVEEDEAKKENKKIRHQTEIYDLNNKEQNQIQNDPEEEIKEYINDNYKKDDLFQNDENNNYKNYNNNIKSNDYYIEENYQNEDYPGISQNSQKKRYFKNNLNLNLNINENNDNLQNEEYYGAEEEDLNGKNHDNNYKYKYKYKKIKKTENEIEKEPEPEEENGQNGNGEEFEEFNEEEDKKEETDFDLQEIKKKPGRILHQSTQETFDEEGNRVVTTKTIKEFKQMTGGIRIRNIENEKEKIEYERYTTNYGKKSKNSKNYNKKTYSTYKSDNRGDRLYLLAQLAKLKNDAEKNKINKNQINKIYNSQTQSPIIIHESNGYDIYENQNSIFSNELVDNNSFEEEIYENNNYRNYGTYDNNYILNNQEYRNKFLDPNYPIRSSSPNGMQEEYFGENYSTNNRRDIPSPIGYIATYSSGSEDNEQIGRSYEKYTHSNYNNNYNNKNTSKHKIDKSIYQKEGELIKKREIIYQLEDPNDYIGFHEKKKKRTHNLSTNIYRTQIDTSKSDKRDFQSPDREAGTGTDRFRRVTMAMISSLGPTCEDRKITRKMRSEIGGVVDLRQELNPVNKYKIKKFQRFGYNLNKEVNPKTKLEGARIIQYWWRQLKMKKTMMIKYIKIVKIQSFIRRFLIRKKYITIKFINYFYDILDNILNNHYKKDLLEIFQISNKDKAKRKLSYLIKILNDKNNRQKLLKYFYKLKYITDFSKNKIDKIDYKEIIETKITEETNIKHIKEKNPLEIKNLEKLDIFGKTKILQDTGIQQIPEKIEQGTQNEIAKNEISNNNKITYLYIKKETKDEYSQNDIFKPEISNNRLNIINKIEKEDEGEQTNPWINIINKNESINLISNQPKKEEKKIIQNEFNQNISLEIIKKKKELHDQEIQYIPEENKIQNQEIEIKGYKPITKDNYSQYIVKKPIICKSNQYSIVMNKKKDLANKYIINKNRVSILSNKKDLTEKGEQYDIPQEYKVKEIIIANNIKRSYTQKIIEILEKIWIKKEKSKFIKNCKDTAKETMIKRELLRMALLRWRFIKGYGGDRYGIIYDRNGNEIGKKEGVVNDVSIQNNLDEEINKINIRNKQLQIRVSKQKPVYIKSNIIHKPKMMSDIGTGDGPNNIILSKIDKITNISYNRKPKPKNRISNKNSFKINKIEKKLKDQGTYMPAKINRIVPGSQILFINKDNNLRNKNINRRRDLMIQIISKKIIRRKYLLYDYFSKWYKQAIKMREYERSKKITQPKITKNEKFEIIQKNAKRERSAGPNRIVHNEKIEFRNKSIKKDIGVNIDLPNMFKLENLKTRKINNDIYKSYQKPIVVRQIKEEDNNYNYNYNYNYGEQEIINNEITNQTGNELGTPIDKEIVDEINIRITEIFVKFLESRTNPKCILRKYLSIWHRNAQYMPLLENAKIISEFCKSKLNYILVRKKWQKLYSKYLFTVKQFNIMKIIKKLRIRKYKIIRLIRMTRLITVFNKRKFLHYIMMYWLIYTITTIKKRNQIKMLYENMLTTYVSMADDIFGKNKKNNPSIQDCMFEIIDTDKFQIKELEDVPIAKIYYSKKNGEKKIITNIKYIEKEMEKENEFYKEINNKYYSPKKSNRSTIEKEEKDIIIGKDEKDSKSEKSGYSYKNIYNKNFNNNEANNKINTHEKYTISTKYGTGGSYTYTGHQKKDSNINNYTNKSDEGNSVLQRRRREHYKVYKTEGSDDNNINNRYSNIKNDEKETDNQSKASTYAYKRNYVKNNYYNNMNENNQNNEKENYKNYFSNNYRKYYNTENNDGKNERQYNSNINSYSSRIKPETSTTYSRHVFTSN